MPTYEYKCDACGKDFERFQPITAEPIKKCPFCKKNKVRRLISTGAGIIFKGSGFYITDYRSESYKAGAKSDSSGTSGSTSPTTPSGGGSAAGGTTPAPAKAEKKAAPPAKK